MAIGQRVFIASTGSHSGSVALADVSGDVLSAVLLADGIEVEVIAWRPRGKSGTRYRVRAPQGVDGWLPAENLRKALVPVPPLEPAPPARVTTVADTGGRRFGQRAHTELPPSSMSPTPAQPLPIVHAGGRRFGQH